MKNNYTNIDSYIKTFPKEIQIILQNVRQSIIDAAPGAVEAISYQMPTFKLNGKNLVHFAAYKKHIGFYPTPSGTENFKKELEKYKTSKGTAQFQLNEPIPYDLIKKIVKFRADESNSSKKSY